MDDDLDEFAAIVVDCGSTVCKVGFAGENNPRAVFPSLVGRPRMRRNVVAKASDKKDVYIGKEAHSKGSVLTLSYPMERGIVTNWNDMEKIWHHAFYNELGVSPTDRAVLLSEPMLNPRANRERMTQVMFETFNVSGLYVACHPFLAIFSHQCTTGIVVDCGDGATYAVPVYEGYVLPHAISQCELAGRDLTQYFCRLLRERNYFFFSTIQELEIVRDAKEKLCYIALDFDMEMKEAEGREKNVEASYELPDGNIITVGSQRFCCPEALFQPGLVGKAGKGIHDIVFESIMRCDADIHKDLFSSIFLCGGSTRFPGFPERLTKELHAVASSVTKVRVKANSAQKYATWEGGSIIASLRTLWENRISKGEYDEMGPSIAHLKCIL